MSKVIEDSDLIAKVKEGNTKAFNILVERYENSIANVVIGLLGECPEAEEVAQEVFLKFYYKIDDFRHDSGLRTYLTRIAINLSLNELKKRKKNRERFVYNEDEGLNKITSSTDSFELKEIIEKALQLIKPSLRAVVVLRLVEGYSTKETAKILKIPIGTVLSRLSRAQGNLKLILKDVKY